MKTLIVLIFLVVCGSAGAQDGIKWLSWDQAMAARTLKPKKLIVFFETQDSPECAKMDSITFKDTIVQWYLNSEYYPVRMDAQLKDTIILWRRYLVYRDYEELGTGYHDLPASLLKHNFTFPAFVVLSEKMERIHAVHGYFNVTLFTSFLDFYSMDANWIDSPMSFGQINYKCTNPNHPHNRLNNLDKPRLEPGKDK